MSAKRGTQYGIRWPTGSVFAFPSREAAEAYLAANARLLGVLVIHEYEAGTANATEWREVPAAAGDTPEGER